MPKTVQDLQARDMLTLEDIADYLGVCRETARRIVHKPGFPLLCTRRPIGSTVRLF